MIERVIQTLAPQWAAKRAQARHLMRLYDAAKSSPQHRMPTGRHSGDGLMEQATDKPRVWARHLDENLDIVTGLLNTLATQAAAITIEPQVKTTRGELAEEVNLALAEKFEDWSNQAEVTLGYTWDELRQLLARTWLRDGEVFIHHLEQTPGVEYPGLPYMVQLLEADFVPYNLTQGSITHGVERNRNGQPLGYHVWDGHPGNTLRPMATLERTTRLDARHVTHLRRVQRLHQVRGITLLHPIIRRLEDLKDYEESERIAARMAASVCLAITRPAGYDTPDVNAVTKEREFYMQAGQVFDNMLPGESIDMLNPTRPSEQAGPWRQLQLKAIAAGAEANYSTLARDYSGTYSSQRQELVENLFQVRHRLQSPMVNRVLKAIWPRFVRQTVLSGSLRMSGIDPETLTRASYNGGSVPWIDMLKEVQAEQAAVEAGFKSRRQVIRERGGNPHQVEQERESEPDVLPPQSQEPVDGPDPAQRIA